LEGADRARRSIREGTAVMKFPLHFGNKTFSDPEGAICFIHCSVGWVVIPAISTFRLSRWMKKST
jgi:hypothetical protein